MNRKSFFRNLLGLVGVAASAKELASLAPKSFEYVVGVDPAMPGIAPTVFRIFVHKDWFCKNDLIEVGPEKAQYHIAKEDAYNSYLANLVWAPDGSVVAKQIRLQDFGDPENMVMARSYPVSVERLCSALPE